jgi:pimeloyl-ACP methyl ester carboxylesterase
MDLRAGDHQLEYVWIGPTPDQAPTIVFLHEGLGCIKIWGEFPKRVCEATGCGVLIYTRAGYGNSDPVPLPWPNTFMHTEATTVLPEVLERLHVREAILFGHSDGGSIALIHAGTSADGIVRGLILEAPHVFVEDLSIAGIRAAKEDYDHGKLRKTLEKYHGQNIDSAFRGWNDIWLNPTFRSWNIEEFLPNIKVPVLLIQGVDDEYGTLAQVKAIEQGIGGPIETMILENCGHDPHRDQTELVLARTKEFINEIFPRS